ncbi:MAG: shikimate dehydrogenase [Flavobacteriaceae bacterium]|nr:shikimate dehydrogenase [Flavobacteriaceae bacterium]
MRKLFGLMGYPLGHSYSKDFFTQKFQEDGLAGYTYKLFSLSNIKQFPELVMRQPDLCGLNVTIPYKREIMLYMDHLDSTAEAVGAVNCIKIRKTKGDILFKGYNTDVLGFEKSLLEFLGTEKIDRALVLGTGGSAAAVCFVLRKMGIGFTSVSRTKTEEAIGYEEITQETIATHQLLVNCTPIGMFPDVDACPEITFKQLTTNHFCFDLVYNPAETLFLKKANETNCHTQNGLDMLKYQALESIAIWENTKVW